MEDENKKKIVEAATNIIGNSAGNIAGSSIGAAIAGPGGALVGGAAGGVLQSLFSWAGNELKERYLSKQERKRVGQVYELAYKKIVENKYAGKKLRESDFFETHEENRSTAEELLEGVLLTAQREYEERKIPFIANLYANICFNSEISQEVANSLLKEAATLSYRDLVIMYCVLVCESNPFIKKKSEYKQVVGLDNVSIATDTYNLYLRTLIHTKSSNLVLGAGNIDPSDLIVSGTGRFLYQLMELEKIPHDEITRKTFSFFSDYQLP